MSAEPVAVVLDDSTGGAAPRRAPAAATATAAAEAPDSEVVCVGPLYLQHQGHSRTIVGVERTAAGETVLLVLDPATAARTVEQRLARGDTHTFVVRASDLRHAQYQVLFVDGVYATAAETEAAKVIASILV